MFDQLPKRVEVRKATEPDVLTQAGFSGSRTEGMPMPNAPGCGRQKGGSRSYRGVPLQGNRHGDGRGTNVVRENLAETTFAAIPWGRPLRPDRQGQELCGGIARARSDSDRTARRVRDRVSQRRLPYL
jgi:hypothetical protein